MFVQIGLPPGKCGMSEARSSAGQRVGLIRFGSRCDVYLPDGWYPPAAVGQRAIAGETVFAGRRNQTLSVGDAADAPMAPRGTPRRAQAPASPALIHLVPNMFTVLALCAGPLDRYALDGR